MLGILVAAAMLQSGALVPFRSVDKATQSFVDSPRQVTARTQAEWSAVWKLHAPSRPLPEVDFAREMVVGLFLGSRNSAGYSVEIVSVEKEPEGLVVRYRETVPGRTTITAQVITSPSHLVAVPKQDGPVRFEKIQ